MRTASRMSGRNFSSAIKEALTAVLTAGCLIVFLCGCAEEDPASRGGKSKEPGIIHYMTGAEQLKTYRKTRSKIKDIDRARKEQIRMGPE